MMNIIFEKFLTKVIDKFLIWTKKQNIKKWNGGKCSKCNSCWIETDSSSDKDIKFKCINNHSIWVCSSIFMNE